MMESWNVKGTAKRWLLFLFAIVVCLSIFVIVKRTVKTDHRDDGPHNKGSETADAELKISKQGAATSAETLRRDPSAFAPSPHQPATDTEKLTAIKEAMDRRAAPELLPFLAQDESPVVQDSALESLTALDAVDSLPAIAGLAASDNEIVSSQVLKSLGTLGGRATEEKDRVFAIEELKQFYARQKETSPGTKRDVQLSLAIEALALIPHPQTTDFLIDELKDQTGNPFLQYFIVTALGQVADPKAFKALDALAASLPPPAVRPRTEEEWNNQALMKITLQVRDKLRR